MEMENSLESQALSLDQENLHILFVILTWGGIYDRLIISYSEYDKDDNWGMIHCLIKICT